MNDPNKDEKHRVGPKLMFCITMYQEEWYQILQSVAGCIRAILELEDLDPYTYHHEKFGIVLICGKWSLKQTIHPKSTIKTLMSIDGIAKLPDPFIEKLLDYHLFHPSLWAYTAARVNENGKHVMKSFKKTETTIASQTEVSLPPKHLFL